VPALTAALKDSGDWTRKCIYIALGRIGPSASSAIPALQLALANESFVKTRTDIARALWRIDPGQFELVSRAIRRSLDEGPAELEHGGRLTYDFLSALDLIGEIGPRAVAFLPDLQSSLSSGDPHIRFNAASAILRVEPAASERAETTLRRLTGIGDYPLEGLGPERWRFVSEDKRDRESYHLRLAAAGALWQYSEESKGPLAVLISDLIRDWEFFTSMKSPIPEISAAAPALEAIVGDAAHAKVHAAAREALKSIRGREGERW
jgi:hypothetical protein